MTYEQVKAMLNNYLSLHQLVKNKRKLWDDAEEDYISLNASKLCERVDSSPLMDNLNAVERCAESRLFGKAKERAESLERDYMEAVGQMMDAENALRKMINSLPPEEQNLIIERYMHGNSVVSIAKKHYYQKEYAYIKFERICKKYAKKTQSD